MDPNLSVSKRVRAPNFSPAESLLLCSVVEKYKHIIESKKTDMVCLQQKQTAWNQITSEFNATTTNYVRTVDSLQQNYKNLKKRAKKQHSHDKMLVPVDRELLIENIEEHGTNNWQEISESVGASEQLCQDVFQNLIKQAKRHDNKTRKDILSTGGGPSNKPDEDPILEKVKTLIGPTIDGIYTIYDGDAQLMASQETAPIEAINFTPQVQSNQPVVDNVEDIDVKKSKFFTNNRSNLRRRIDPLLTSTPQSSKKPKQKSCVSEKFNSLAEEKIELVTIQKEIAKVQLEIDRQTLVQSKRLWEIQLQEEEEKLEHNRRIRELKLRMEEENLEHIHTLRRLAVQISKTDES